ncbi:MAG TPA: DUF86 domain-containing protein [Paraburkholderia sp.]|nr:DUF86 domain-containing protein [Paraburkholderia sp.]
MNDRRQLWLADYLEHMLEAARLAQQHIAGVEKEQFLGDRLRQQAVMMNLVIIGEAATKIREGFPDFIQANPSPALPWHQMIGMRNRMAHGYFDVDLEIVWDTVTKHLPVLENFLATHAPQGRR